MRPLEGAIVAVVGSVNSDRRSYVERLPVPGETVLAAETRESLGGKGANQAVAAAKVGSQVWFLGHVGADEAGRTAVDQLAKAGVDTARITIGGRRTGTAHVTVSKRGENTIVVDPGANAAMRQATLGEGTSIELTAAYDLVDILTEQVARSAVITLGAGGAVVKDGGHYRVLPIDSRAARTHRAAEVLTQRRPCAKEAHSGRGHRK